MYGIRGIWYMVYGVWYMVPSPHILLYHTLYITPYYLSCDPSLRSTHPHPLTTHITHTPPTHSHHITHTPTIYYILHTNTIYHIPYTIYHTNHIPYTLYPAITGGCTVRRGAVSGHEGPRGPADEHLCEHRYAHTVGCAHAHTVGCVNDLNREGLPSYCTAFINVILYTLYILYTL